MEVRMFATSDIAPTGFFGADLAEITPGDTVAVFGCGPVGLFAIVSARLLPVSERARYLFGKDEGKAAAPQRKKREPQMDLFKVLESVESEAPMFGETKLSRIGETVLDRIHQSMILFAAGRGEALKRLLVEDEAGHERR